MHKGFFETVAIHKNPLGDVIYNNTVRAEYEIIEGNINDNPVYRFSITKNGDVFRDGTIRSTRGREMIYEWFQDLVRGVV